VLRESRPARETVHDEVQSRLISQQRALQSNIEKLSRCVATNVKDSSKLREDRAAGPAFSHHMRPATLFRRSQL
jgi:hypothetical protein